MFYSVYLFTKFDGWKQSLYSAIGFAIGTCIRSNGLFYITVSGYPILSRFIRGILKGDIKRAVKEIPLGLVVGLIFLIPYSASLYFPY